MIKKIEIKNLRNHLNYNLDISKSIVLFEGPNGSGKTSILESIYFAATSKSHRTSNEKDMITYEKPFGLVRLETNDNLFEMILSEKGKRAFINKNEIKKISDYVGKLHVVMFAPEDLFLVKGGPAERRYFIDLELMQVSKEYLRLLNSYKRILKQRNALLKKIEDNDDYTFLNILAEQLFECGSKIYDYRFNFIEELNSIIKKNSLKYDNFNITIKYEPNVLKENWLKQLKTKQKQDIIYQTTMSGIHKDDFQILYNGFSAKDNASQGNVRLIVIELKLALLEWINNTTSTKTILLLDDVLSELDIDRQNMFLSMLPTNSQIFISSAIPITKNFDIQKVYIPKEIKHG